MRSQKQRARQESEYRRGGKYARVNPCYACGKSAGVEYFSHPLTDCPSPKGDNWHDLALVLCARCCKATQDMQEPEEFRKYAAQFGDASERAWDEVAKQRGGA